MESIKFEKFTLSNGLDVILHQDRSLPLTSVNLWYHVGSKDEKPGKTGYAHLFEHLMFEGSKHHNRSHFEPLQKIGASLNGSTTPDRTNYWEDIPSNYLELALWLESDRMGFLLDALDQQSFDIQRDVVKNERRQSYENRPYGMASIKLQESLYPLPHPYHWPTIGFHEDLDAATVQDAKDFFNLFYTPSNASLVLAGDFELDAAKDLVDKYFSNLPPGRSVPRITTMASPIASDIKLTMYDQVLLPRLILAWPTVQRFHPDEAALSLLASILSDGKSSRLHKSLVYASKMAQSVFAYQSSSEISGDFNLISTAAESYNLADIENVLMDEIGHIQNHSPSEDELKRAKNQLEWRYVRQMALLGGFAGRANRLNSFNVFGADPGLINTDINRFLNVSSEEISSVARKYLSSLSINLSVLPEPSRFASSIYVDRSSQPSSSPEAIFSPPLPEEHSSPTGLNIIVLEKPEIPIVSCALLLQSGSSRDPIDKAGLSSFTTAMLQEGTTSRSSQDIAQAFESMGTQLNSSTGRENTLFSVESLTKHFPTALELLSDLVQNPSFPSDEFIRLKNERLTSLRRIKDDPASIAMRVSHSILYGQTSPYGHPISGFEDSINNINRADLIDHFTHQFFPGNMTLIISGNISVSEVNKLVEKYFSSPSSTRQKTVISLPAPAPAPVATPAIYLVDKPGAAQSIIRTGYVGVPRDHADYLALNVINHIFGGQFTARLNMNLRQDKGYSYGYNSWIEWMKASSILMTGGSVETDVTKEAVQEVLEEYSSIVSTRLITDEEFDASRRALIRQFPSAFQTTSSIVDQLIRLAQFGLPINYYQSYVDNLNALSLSGIQNIAKSHIDRSRLLILVVGDISIIKPGLEELKMEIHELDVEGSYI